MRRPKNKDMLAGRYELQEALGSGGMGTVFKAHDRRTKQTVAIKLLHHSLGQDTDYIKRFRREAEISRSIDSHYTVQTLASGEDNGSHFLVMEYVKGETLAGRLQREKRLSQDNSLRIAVQVARALESAAHRRL